MSGGESEQHRVTVHSLSPDRLVKARRSREGWGWGRVSFRMERFEHVEKEDWSLGLGTGGGC